MVVWYVFDELGSALPTFEMHTRHGWPGVSTLLFKSQEVEVGQAERSASNCETPAGTALRLVRPTLAIEDSKRRELTDSLILAIEDPLITYRSDQSKEPVEQEVYPHGIGFHRGSLDAEIKASLHPLQVV